MSGAVSKRLVIDTLREMQATARQMLEASEKLLATLDGDEATAR